MEFFGVGNDFSKKYPSFSKMHKRVVFMNDKVIIEHFVFDEYKTHSFCDQYSSRQYLKDVEGSYRLCERLGLCRVLEVRYGVIVTVMPRYGSVDSKASDFWERLEDLVMRMYVAGIVHYDFALRNVGVDSAGAYQLIDLCSVFPCESREFEESIVFRDFPEKRVRLENGKCRFC